MKTHILLFTLFVFTITLSGQNSGSKLLLLLEGENKEETELLNTIPHTKSFTESALLYNEIDSITNQLITEGYFDIKKTVQQSNNIYTAILSLNTRYDSLTLDISKHPILKTYIKETAYTIDNDILIIETAFAKALLEQLTTIAANNGDPFASFQITELTKTNNIINGRLEVTSNKQRKITDVIYKGYPNYPITFLNSITKKVLNKTYNQEKLNTINDELRSLRFISTTKKAQALFKKDSTTVFYYIKKIDQNQFDGFIGFRSNEDNTLRLDGYLDLQLINNFNYGEELSFNYKSDGEDQSQLKIKASLPYILKTPLGIESSLSIFRKDSTFSTTDINIQAYYHPTTNHKISTGYNNITSENLLTIQETEQEVADFKTTTVYLEYQYTKRNNDYFFPITTQFHFQTNYGTRIANMTKTPQTQILLKMKRIFNFNNKNSIYISGSFNSLFSKNYITNELFRLGGITSIRGFEENSIFANLSGIINTEYRLKLSNSLYINTVTDGGYVENSIANEKNYLLSLGAGAGIRTKAGLLQINIANGKFNNSALDFSNTKLHLILAVRF